jgi:hypothetical protein
MAAPNLINASTINGKTTGANLTTNTVTTILNNLPSSGKVLKINTLNISNYTANAAGITLSYYTAANLGGNALMIVGNVTVAAFSTLNIIDKSNQYYVEENASIGATATAANNLIVTTSYEEIS